MKIFLPKRFIKAVKINGSKRSVDTDGIHPTKIKHCGQQFQIVLLITLQEGKYDTFIKKPGNENYNCRPIASASYIGEYFEIEDPKPSRYSWNSDS